MNGHALRGVISRGSYYIAETAVIGVTARFYLADSKQSRRLFEHSFSAIILWYGLSTLQIGPDTGVVFYME